MGHVSGAEMYGLRAPAHFGAGTGHRVHRPEMRADASDWAGIGRLAIGQGGREGSGGSAPAIRRGSIPIRGTAN